MKRSEVLDKAKHEVTGQRLLDYGSPENNFSMIADMWGTYLDTDIAPADVAAMMILLKVARIGNGGGTGDSWVDIAGYAACGGEIESIRKGDPNEREVLQKNQT